MAMSTQLKSLLIIEDSVSITWRLLNFLKDVKNLKILGSVRNGTSGYKRIVNEKPDIILLDIQLPGTNGLKILELLKDQEHKPYIIIFTNNSNFYFKERCFALGADEFYDKSVQFEEAIKAIIKFCNNGVNSQ